MDVIVHTTNKNFDLVLETRGTDILLYNGSRDVTSRAIPAFARFVENKNNLKMLRVLFLQSFKFFTKEDILLRYIGVKQLELRFVVFVRKGMVKDLIERSAIKSYVSIYIMHESGYIHASTSPNQSHFFKLVD